MRVAHIVGAFSKLPETYLYDLFLESVAQGIDAHVVTSERVNIEERPFVSVHLFTIPYYENLAKIQPVTSMIPRDPEDMADMHHGYERAIRQIVPDVIHAHFGELGWQVLSVAQKLELPLVVSFYGYDVSRLPRNPVWRERYQALFAYIARAIVVSEVMRQALIELGCAPTKIVIIHVGKKIDDYPLKDVRQPLRQWITVGRLVEKKGMDDAIRAIATLAPTQPLSLTIIGDGPQRPFLQDLATTLGCDHLISFMGALPDHAGTTHPPKPVNNHGDNHCDF